MKIKNYLSIIIGIASSLLCFISIKTEMLGIYGLITSWILGFVGFIVSISEMVIKKEFSIPFIGMLLNITPFAVTFAMIPEC